MITNDNLKFIADQLTNSMEFYSKDEFLSHISEQTGLTVNQVETIWQKYYDLHPHERIKIGWDIDETTSLIKNWLLTTF